MMKTTYMINPHLNSKGTPLSLIKGGGGGGERGEGHDEDHVYDRPTSEQQRNTALPKEGERHDEDHIYDRNTALPN